MDSLLTSENASLITLVAVVLWALLQMLWRIQDRSREAGDQYEPKATPPLHKEYASKEELRTVDTKVDFLRSDMQREFRETRDSSSRSREKIYEGLRSLETKVAGLETISAEQRGAVYEVRQDVKALLGSKK